VHLHSGTAWLGLVARLTTRGPAFVLEVHDAPGSGHRGRWSHAFDGFCVRRLGMVALCHSQQVVEAVEREYRVAGRTRQFPLGIDTDRFVPVAAEGRDAWRAEHGIDTSAFLMVAVGRGAPSKRFDLAIDVVAAARAGGTNVHLMILGVGEDERLRAHARSLGVSDRVHLQPRRFGDDLAVAMGSGDVLCSTSEYESFGLTLVEGMACGLPVVAMDVGGVSDLVEDGVTGYLTPFGDVDTHTGRVVAIAADVELHRRLGTAARRAAVADFGLAAMSGRFTGMYRDLSEVAPERVRC
jgi:glycosyltransferase involved in cell wall biosynthesis